jgi:hypothetical protein
MEDRRIRLATIILQLASNGVRDARDLKEAALEIIHLKEQPRLRSRM